MEIIEPKTTNVELSTLCFYSCLLISAEAQALCKGVKAAKEVYGSCSLWIKGHFKLVTY